MARAWGDEFGYNPAMSGDYDTLPRLDSPDVPAEVVLQFPYTRLHVHIMARCGHIASGKASNFASLAARLAVHGFIVTVTAFFLSRSR